MCDLFRSSQGQSETDGGKAVAEEDEKSKMLREKEAEVSFISCAHCLVFVCCWYVEVFYFFTFFFILVETYARDVGTNAYANGTEKVRVREKRNNENLYRLVFLWPRNTKSYIWCNV